MTPLEAKRRAAWEGPVGVHSEKEEGRVQGCVDIPIESQVALLKGTPEPTVPLEPVEGGGEGPRCCGQSLELEVQW